MAILIKPMRLAVFFLFLLCGAAASHAVEPLVLQEQEIKAGLIYNFLKYTDWPASALASTSSVHVCLFGEDSFEKQLKPMEGRSVNHRTIEIRKIGQVSEVADCHLLFLTSVAESSWLELKNALTGKSILTVSDMKNFAINGGMIEFGWKDERINVLLNMEAVMAAQLKVQDRLLKLVTVVSAPKKMHGS